VPESTLPALASDAVILHIGPHKTGTTAIQGALFVAREKLREHGTVYAGPGRQPYLAALYATSRSGRRGDPTPKQKHWDQLCRDARKAAGQRFVISSERFAAASDEAIPTIVDGLDRTRVHVIITLRPLAKILPSQWQQYVQNGVRLSYGEWLHHIFEDPPFTNPTNDFWVRHSHGELVRRWSAAVGTDNITVIVVDDEDHDMLTRSFETLLDLPAGFLVPESNRTNRSLTYGETEIIRQLNVETAKHKWSDGDYRHFIRRGVTIELKNRTPHPDEMAIATPQWAADRAAAASATAADQVRALGVTVLGDLDQLTRLPRALTTDAPGDEPDVAVPATAATAGIVGAINAALVSQAKPGAEEKIKTSDPLARPLGNVPTATIARVLADRARRRVGLVPKSKRREE
jgi:hypothetical protein